ncbi:MAG TPA: hypothetical protein VGL46_12640 [Pseudonocardiaceae bacterium]|jgi:hypothetical protein
MDKAEYVARELQHLAPDRGINYVVRAVRMIEGLRTKNPSPEYIREQLVKTLSGKAPFTQISFIEEAVRLLTNRA